MVEEDEETPVNEPTPLLETEEVRGVDLCVCVCVCVCVCGGGGGGGGDKVNFRGNTTHRHFHIWF